MTGTKTSKASLRNKMKKVINDIPIPERKKQSNVVVKKYVYRGNQVELLKGVYFLALQLFNLNQYRNAKTVSVFLSMDTEIDTEPIVRRIFEDGKQCFVPRYNRHTMEMVELHSAQDWENLPVTKWNIKQPDFGDNRRDAMDTGLDLIIVPGVAFTKTGERLGHGGGYYDIYLSTIIKKQVKSPAMVGVAFKEQIVDEIPCEETDVQIDLVLYADK
nr:unnamed protein product [Callosobruchus chinensis]